jgi:hypothetical protein
MIVAAVLAAGVAYGAAPVTGSITVSGETVALVKAYVDESPNDVIVVLASKEVPRDVVPFIGEDVARKLKIHAIAFTVSRADRALARGFGGVFYPGAEMGFAGLGEGNVSLEVKRLDATGIEGRIFTPKPVEGYDMTYTLDASFALPLGSAAPPPPPIEVTISGDTSSPAKAYAAYYRAAISGDAATMAGFLAKERRAQFDGADKEEKGFLLEMLKGRPAEIRIGAPIIAGSKAAFKVEGLNETSGRSTAEVSMVQEKGAWKLEKESWTTTSP